MFNPLRNLFKRIEPTKAQYVILARYRKGDWFRSFTVESYDSYGAARKFDLLNEYQDWTRVSGATLRNPLLPNNE